MTVIDNSCRQRRALEPLEGVSLSMDIGLLVDSWVRAHDECVAKMNGELDFMPYGYQTLFF